MKRTLAILVAAVLVVALFAGCAGGGAATPSASAAPSAAPTAAPSAAPTANPTAAPTAAPSAEPESPYNFATGVEYDANGIPVAPYEYQLPLSTTDETLSYWTGAWLTQYLTDMGEDVPAFKELRKVTGVNIEYLLVSAGERKNNFSVMLASDDLPDIMANVNSSYPASMQNAIEDEFFVNIYDYQQYCPNYIYYVNAYGAEEAKTVYIEKDMIATMNPIYESLSTDTGSLIRSDWVEEVGWKVEDIKTYDDLHTVLAAWKTQGICDWPYLMNAGIDGGRQSAGYDTLAQCDREGANVKESMYVVDGKVRMAFATDECRDYIALMAQWYDEGLINPNWTTMTDYGKTVEPMSQGQSGYAAGNSDHMTSWADSNVDTGATVAPLPRMVKEEGQTLHLGVNLAHIKNYGTAISTKCENIPLAITWVDFAYSKGGYDLMNYGVEGLTYNRGADGKIVLTEMMTKDPDGRSLVQMYMIKAGLPNFDAMLYDSWRLTYYEGGESRQACYDAWISGTPNDGAYNFPLSLTLTDEQNEDFTAIWGDLGTYLIENYFAFIDGTKPMSEWDSFVKGLKDMGWDDALAIYQTAYDDYMAA